MGVLTFKQFEEILATIRDLTELEHVLFTLINDIDEISDETYSMIVKLHDSAIDCIEVIDK